MMARWISGDIRPEMSFAGQRHLLRLVSKTTGGSPLFLEIVSDTPTQTTPEYGAQNPNSAPPSRRPKVRIAFTMPANRPPIAWRGALTTRKCFDSSPHISLTNDEAGGELLVTPRRCNQRR